MISYRHAGLLALILSFARAATGQTPTDAVRQGRNGPIPLWLSLGVGGGYSNRGGLAGRAAASVGLTPVVMLTLDGTSVGSIDGSVDSINLMVGVRTPQSDGLLFLSTGVANTSCGSGCANQTGIAFEGGFHIGGRHAGVGLIGFAVLAPERSSSSGIIASFDFGWLFR